MSKFFSIFLKLLALKIVDSTTIGVVHAKSLQSLKLVSSLVYICTPRLWCIFLCPHVYDNLISSLKHVLVDF